MPATRIVVPAKAKKGELVEIKTIINHPHGDRLPPRQGRRRHPARIITRFTCTYAGEEVFRMDLFTGVAANPFVAFTTHCDRDGRVGVRMDRPAWRGDPRAGAAYRHVTRLPRHRLLRLGAGWRGAPRSAVAGWG